MKKMRKDIRIRVLCDLWMPAFWVFTLVYFLGLNDTGLILTIVFMTFYDWYVMEQKGFIKNLTCNLVTMVLYIIIYAQIVPYYPWITDLNPFFYGFFSGFMSYIVYDKLTHYRKVNAEWKKKEENKNAEE